MDKEEIESFKKTREVSSIISKSMQPVDKDVLNLIKNTNNKSIHTHSKCGGRRLVPKPFIPCPVDKQTTVTVGDVNSSEKQVVGKDIILDKDKNTIGSLNQHAILDAPPVSCSV